MTSKPSVLHVGSLPPPYGGVAVMLQWALTTPDLGAFVRHVYDLSRGEDWEYVGRKGLSMDRALRRVKLAAGLATLSSRLKPDLVHFHCGSGGRWDFLGDMLLLAAARTGGAPILFHWHRDTSTSIYPGRGWLTRTIFRNTVGRARVIGVLFDAYRQHLDEIGLGGRAKVIPNTFDPALLDLDLRHGVSDQVQIAYIGRLSQEKGFFDLVGAVQQMVSKPGMPLFQVKAAGSADPAFGGLQGIQDELTKLCLADRITLLGPVDRDAKLRLLGESDLFALPSYRESFGIVALEAMAAALPVVAYDTGRLDDLLGEGGKLVPKGSVSDLAESLIELCRDELMRKRMGAAGRQRAQARYAPSSVALRISEIYHQMLAHKGPGPG